MMKRPTKWLVVVGLLSPLALASTGRAQEREIELDQVPAAVLNAAKAKFPGAKIREASKETEEGKTVFELEMTREARHIDVTFREDGTLVLVEAQVTEDEVPAAVLKAVKGGFPGAKIKLVEAVKKGPEIKRETDYYEFHLATADKKSVEVEVDAAGKILKTEEKKAEEKDEDERE